MKINVKTLKGNQFQVEVESDMTVIGLKTLISDAQNDHPVETQKLIAMGKIMDDDTKTMSDFKLVENNTIVLMTIKVKPVKPSPASEEIKTPEVSFPDQAASITNQPAQEQATDQSTPLPEGVTEELVSTLMAVVARPREMCIQALEISSGNINNACTLIFSGNFDRVAPQ